MKLRPLIVHVVFRFDYGGLENGVVNVINGLDGDAFRHAVIALTESAPGFRWRLGGDVPVYALGKRPGKDPAAYWRLFRLLRKLRPAVVHTRNIGTLDCAVVAMLAGVPVRIHGEHGWDVSDQYGMNRKYRLLRRALGPFVGVFVTVSDELRAWLTTVVGIPARKVRRICNGVDTARFRPARSGETERSPAETFTAGCIVIGSVSRLSAIKDPLNVVDAFLNLRANPAFAERPLRLLIVGDGELRAEALARLERAGATHAAWLPGSRDDIPELLRAMDVFVLGSLREGVSNTILEAMATGMPVVATDTGGNGELVTPGETGLLVPPGDCVALAGAIGRYVADEELRRRHGLRARERAVAEFSLETMIDNYRQLYASALRPAPLEA